MEMKTLLGITQMSSAKNYMFPKFFEMLDVCVRPVEGVDIAWASERAVDERDIWVPSIPTSSSVEDILMTSREQFRILAIDEGYDKLVWQGVDAPYQSRSDFERLISHDVPVVAPLINARGFDNYAVARRFYKISDRLNMKLLENEGVAEIDNIEDKIFCEEQYDIPHEDLMSGELIESGFPGGDNIALRKDVLDISWVGNHDPWYQRVAEGRPNIDCIEWFCLEVLNRGQMCYVDTSISVWHVHEDGTARMYPGITKPLSELSW